MKRSEVRELICCTILEHKECCTAVNIAELILIELERVGMQPPFAKFNLDENRYMYYANKWEPENEKK